MGHVKGKVLTPLRSLIEPMKHVRDSGANFDPEDAEHRVPVPSQVAALPRDHQLLPLVERINLGGTGITRETRGVGAG